MSELHLTEVRVTVMRSDGTEIVYSIGKGPEGVRLDLSTLPGVETGQLHINVNLMSTAC
jgi:hypothetical protein